MVRGVVRACVGVGGRENKIYLSKRLPKCLHVQLQCLPMYNHRSQHDMSFRPVG